MWELDNFLTTYYAADEKIKHRHNTLIQSKSQNTIKPLSDLKTDVNNVLVISNIIYNI